MSPQTFADVDRGATGGIAAAPVLVVVCADNERGLEQTVPSSIFPAVQNLLLAATALGLGSALTTIAIGYRAELAELLALPAHVVPVAVVPLGHPARPLGRPKRDPFASTRTASATASRGPATPDRAVNSVAVRLRLRVLRVLFAHDQHRARRVAQDVLARRPEHEPLDAGAPVRADDDEVGADLGRDGADGGGGIADLRPLVDLTAARARRPSR